MSTATAAPSATSVQAIVHSSVTIQMPGVAVRRLDDNRFTSTRPIGNEILVSSLYENCGTILPVGFYIEEDGVVANVLYPSGTHGGLLNIMQMNLQPNGGTPAVVAKRKDAVVISGWGVMLSLEVEPTSQDLFTRFVSVKPKEPEDLQVSELILGCSQRRPLGFYIIGHDPSSASKDALPPLGKSRSVMVIYPETTQRPENKEVTAARLKSRVEARLQFVRDTYTRDPQTNRVKKR